MIKYKKNGFTLIEVMIALMILLVVLLGAASSQISAIKSNARAFYLNKTLIIAQTTLEKFYLLPYNSSIFNAGSHTEANPSAGYKIKWNVIDGDEKNNTVTNTKHITVIVTKTTIPTTKITLSTIKARL